MGNRRNIVLAGFMGAGKSSAGRRVAEALGMTFADMDDCIVAHAGKPISRIFAEDGEPAFRAIERAVVVDLSARTGLVIATGGGVVLDPDNLRDFSATGVVICLSATPETILERLRDDTTRPLLHTGDKLARIRTLLETRRHLYDAIPLQVNTSALPPDAVARRILELYASA